VVAAVFVLVIDIVVVVAAVGLAVRALLVVPLEVTKAAEVLGVLSIREAGG